MYDDKKNAYDLQFKLPSGFSAYNDADDFINFYPFVPYQFRLIMKVFDSFLNLGYVAREVKGNERSIIKVVHATAKNSADSPVGKFISFDELYNNMFEEGLQARGRAIAIAPHLACPCTTLNRSSSGKISFPANFATCPSNISLTLNYCYRIHMIDILNLSHLNIYLVLRIYHQP